MCLVGVVLVEWRGSALLFLWLWRLQRSTPADLSAAVKQHLSKTLSNPMTIIGTFIGADMIGADVSRGSGPRVVALLSSAQFMTV